MPFAAVVLLGSHAASLCAFASAYRTSSGLAWKVILRCMPLYAAALFVSGSSSSVLGRFIRSSLESGGVMKVTHIVGMQGSGKSVLARLIS